MSWGLEGLGDVDRDGRERAENMESARSTFPVLTSFGNTSDAKVGRSVGLPFETGEEVVDEGLEVCETWCGGGGADWGNHFRCRGAETGTMMRLWMSWVMGGVIGEGKVGGKELNVRNNDGRMLWAHEVKDNLLRYSGRHTLRVRAATRRVCRCYPSRLLILGHRRSTGDFK